MPYSNEPVDQISFVIKNLNKNIGKNISKNMSNKYNPQQRQQIIDKLNLI